MSSKRRCDVSIVVTAFYMKAIGFWLANNGTERRRRIYAMMYTVILLALAVIFEIRDLYFTWGDFNESIYIICNIASVAMGLFKMLILFIHKVKLLDLVQYAKVNFWETNYEPQERMIVENCRSTCTLLICIFNFFAQGTVASYLIRPLAANIGKNESDRILPFNMWLDWPLSMTPYFEFTLGLQILTLYHVGICYICFDNLLCILNLHTAGQFRVLRRRLINLYSMNDHGEADKFTLKPKCDTDRYYKTFRDCIQQHQALIGYCNRLEGVFTMIVLGQVLLFSLLMCLDGYLILMDSAPSTQRLTFLFHITGCMVQLLMFTYSCDILIRESGNIANAAYECPWTALSMDKGGKYVRNDIVLVIMRSQLPCCLTAGGFFPVSLETYTTVLSSAVSYFTLLMQY